MEEFLRLLILLSFALSPSLSENFNTTNGTGQILLNGHFTPKAINSV